MYFRSRKKLQGEVSLSDTIEPDAAGNALCLMDVVGCDDTMLSDMADREERLRIRQLVDACLTDREAEVIRRRYGLSGRLPQTQRQVAAAFGISRSYVSRRAYCKRPETPAGAKKCLYAQKRLAANSAALPAAFNRRYSINFTNFYKNLPFLTIRKNYCKILFKISFFAIAF